MLFTAGLKLLNLHLTYLRVILRIELLKFHPKRSEFVKSGGFSILKFSIVVLTGFTTLVNSFYTLIFTRLGKVETLFVALFAIGLSLASIFAIYLLHYLDDFKFLLSTLQRLDYAFGRHFSGYPNRNSILGLQFCFVSTLLVGIGGPFFLLLLNLYDPKMHPFLGSLVHWSIFVIGSFTVFILGNVFLGTSLSTIPVKSPSIIRRFARATRQIGLWIYGDYTEPATNHNMEIMATKFKTTLKNIHPFSKTLYMKTTEYFPHVTSDSIRKGFYSNFDSIQGDGGLYYGTTLLTLECVTNAIELGEKLVAKYF
ncbi:hypothetical protein Fcan01_16850 [Folsomia candida]|uniref:Uncharacterized protein n=1 Tax=Folsomia candida TaxID=158441 RepID=A0A226DV09_FOLCA|nr:hypothetical protein Fcan01_16850 [Folsomia candida]